MGVCARVHAGGGRSGVKGREERCTKSQQMKRYLFSHLIQIGKQRHGKGMGLSQHDTTMKLLTPGEIPLPTYNPVYSATLLFLNLKFKKILF